MTFMLCFSVTENHSYSNKIIFCFCKRTSTVTLDVGNSVENVIAIGYMFTISRYSEFSSFFFMLVSLQKRFTIQRMFIDSIFSLSCAPTQCSLCLDTETGHFLSQLVVFCHRKAVQPGICICFEVYIQKYQEDLQNLD